MGRLFYELRAENEKKKEGEEEEKRRGRRRGRRKNKQTDACNEETLLRFASTHILSEVIRQDEWMDRKQGKEEEGKKERAKRRREAQAE